MALTPLLDDEVGAGIPGTGLILAPAQIRSLVTFVHVLDENSGAARRDANTAIGHQDLT